MNGFRTPKTLDCKMTSSICESHELNTFRVSVFHILSMAWFQLPGVRIYEFSNYEQTVWMAGQNGIASLPLSFT